MMKKTTALFVATALGGASLPALAAGFGHQQSMRADGQNLYVAETSARILGNAQSTAPQLLDDITDGVGKKKIPGYKIMLMSRTSSLAVDARPLKDHQGWRDNRYIHRGTKVLVGIPVRGGKMDLPHAKLLSLAAIVDDQTADFKAEDKIRPRGKQWLKKETTVTKPELHISALSLPDMVSGETSGGGVKLRAAATLDGRRVETSINSTFTLFDAVKPDNARGFNADARFVQ